MFQKLYRHLEEINASLHKQAALSEDVSSHHKAILDQLQQLNENISIGQKALPQMVKKPSPAWPIILSVIICLAITDIVILHIQLSKATRDFSDARAIASRQYEEQLQKYNALYNPPGQQNALTVQLLRLDTIVSQQSQRLLELNSLSKISVHTFTRLTKRIDQTDRLLQDLRPDSTHYIGRAN